MKFIIDIYLKIVRALRTAITAHGPDHFKSPSYAPVFGVTRFHAYSFGHHFTLIIDNKVIMSLFDSNKPISPQASGQIQ